jgi:hypothetical protein
MSLQTSSTRADYGTSDPMSINFVPTSLTETFEVMNHIQYDLIVRSMQFDGDLDELRLLLIERLQMEHDLNELQDAIILCAPHADAFVDPAKLIPCSLHLQMRMGLKMSTKILAERLNSYMVKLDQVKFIEKIENIVDEDFFGTKESTSSWHFPSAEADGESALLVMGDVRLPNSKVQCLIPNINSIIYFCIKDKQRNSMARDCLLIIGMRWKLLHVLESTQQWNCGHSRMRAKNTDGGGSSCTVLLEVKITSMSLSVTFCTI